MTPSTPMAIESAVLAEVIRLHPTRLTLSELIVRMTGAEEGPRRVAICDSVEELKRSGLARTSGEAIEPTYAALRAHSLLVALQGGVDSGGGAGV